MKENVLIDSYGWIEYFSEGPKANKYAKYVDVANTSQYITPSIILYEVYKKIKATKGEDMALKAISYIIHYTTIIAIDKKISLNAAEISLKTRLSMADAIIKAVAEERNAKIITSDEHLKNFSDVIFIA